jgi:simple sugar transport system substrate-binding protein
MPEAMEDGMVKVALIRNMTVEDYARQYMESCIAEGRSMGFIVDSFVLAADNGSCRERIARITAADYDGLILSMGGADFDYVSILPAIKSGIKIVTFDTLPYREDDPRKEPSYGITATAQDDAKLAELSLQALIDYFASDYFAPSIRIISIIADPGTQPLDSRHAVYDKFLRSDKIIEAARISPPDSTYVRSGIREALINLLADFPTGTIDAIWAPYDEYAKGCIDALEETGRREIKLVSVDVSNNDLKMMMSNAGQWIASATTDPSIAGIINMRLLAAKLAGEDTPATYVFGAHLVETSALNNSITMANIALHLPAWSSYEGLFEYPWMTELKNCVAGRLGK